MHQIAAILPKRIWLQIKYYETQERKRGIMILLYKNGPQQQEPPPPPKIHQINYSLPISLLIYLFGKKSGVKKSEHTTDGRTREWPACLATSIWETNGIHCDCFSPHENCLNHKPYQHMGKSSPSFSPLLHDQQLLQLTAATDLFSQIQSLPKVSIFLNGQWERPYQGLRKGWRSGRNRKSSLFL